MDSAFRRRVARIAYAQAELNDDVGGPGGSSGYSYVSVAAGYTETAANGEKVVAVTASGQTVVLPDAAVSTAKLTFKLMVAGTLVLDGHLSQTIDGGATATLTQQYEAVTVVSTGAHWIVI